MRTPMIYGVTVIDITSGILRGGHLPSHHDSGGLINLQ